MNILLDTHIFLWYITKDGRMPSKIASHIRQPRNGVYLSVVSIWEVIIKHDLGKLPLPESPETYLPVQRDRHQIANLDLNETAVLQLAKLAPHHRDPFDRMLLCQAIQHDLFLATVDEKFSQYPVNILPF